MNANYNDNELAEWDHPVHGDYPPSRRGVVVTDLAERLRAYRAGDDPGVAVEAADEIERLRAELAAAEHAAG